MGKPTQPKRRRSRSVAQAAAARRRRRRLGVIGVGLAALLALGSFTAAWIGMDNQPAPRDDQPSVQSFTLTDRNHVDGPVRYPVDPPVGGNHSPVWQDCGAYDQPVANETAVHSLEHGAVWITYRPGLPTDQLTRLRDLASAQPFVLLSPYPQLPAPVVASAWGKQARFGSAGEPALAAFLAAYRQGPQTPEPGAPCTGGTATPA